MNQYPRARLMKNCEIWCGHPRCRGKFGYVIMDAGVSNQFFVLDSGFHEIDSVWEKSARSLTTGRDRRGKIATFGGPRKGVARYSPPERPVLLRCPRCNRISDYWGEGESREAINKPLTDSKEAVDARSAADAERHIVFRMNAAEYWANPEDEGRRAAEFFRNLLDRGK